MILFPAVNATGFLRTNLVDQRDGRHLFPLPFAFLYSRARRMFEHHRATAKARRRRSAYDNIQQDVVCSKPLGNCMYGGKIV